MTISLEQLSARMRQGEQVPAAPHRTGRADLEHPVHSYSRS